MINLHSRDSEENFPSYFSMGNLNFEFLCYLARKLMFGSGLVCLLVLLNLGPCISAHKIVQQRTLWVIKC